MSTSLLDAGILGIIEGLTEFIPVSSTGHLILGSAALDLSGAETKVFEVFIQIGAILAVIWARRQRVMSLAWGFFTDKKERFMGLKIIAAFLPSAIVGVLAHDFIKNVLFNAHVVAFSLIAGGVILMLAERMAPKPRFNTIDALPMKTAIGIGVCQILSLIPGISRAGASIVGARFLAANSAAATEFSFFLAIPTIIGAAVFDLYKNIHLLTMADLPVFAMGTVTAFFSALFIVDHMIAFVSKHGFKPFGWYRIVIGAIVLGLLQTGWL